MSQETLNLMLKLDRKELEAQIALQCAPLLCGIKISNLLTVQRKHKKEVLRLFYGTAVCCYILFESGSKITFLLYNRNKLEAYLKEAETAVLMEEFGYKGCSLGQILREVASKYREHMEGNAEFPHEIGLLLGYPPEDVKGFIIHQGKNCLEAGYWKVYADLAGRRRIFADYDNAREEIIWMLSAGMRIRKILECRQAG